MSKIEFGELRIGPYAEMQLKQVIRSNWASGGPKVKEFEEKFGKLFNAKCAAVSSGTDADINACLYLYEKGTERGKSEVIIPALCFIAVANAVRAAGLIPRFVDIDPATLNIDPSKVGEAINKNTVAIMGVNTMGKPCAVEYLSNICRKEDLTFIVDNCEGHGCQHQGRYMEEYADICTYSFYIAHLVCCGEGGAITSKHPDVIQNVLSTRSHGRLPGDLYFDHVRTGLNSKMNDMEAAVGLEGIENFERTFKRRHEIMTEINGFLERFSDKIWTSRENGEDVNCPHGISITFKEKDNGAYFKLLNQLATDSIHQKRNFGCIPTQHGAFADMGYKLGDFPKAEHVGDYGIHIGCHQYLSKDDVKYIITSLEKGLS